MAVDLVAAELTNFLEASESLKKDMFGMRDCGCLARNVLQEMMIRRLNDSTNFTQTQRVAIERALWDSVI